MDPERWQRIDAAVQRAIESDPAERSEVLRAALSGDRELHAAAAELLVADAGAGDFLAVPWVLAASRSGATESPAGPRTPADPEVHRAGDRVGPYRLLRPIGSGGMGVVFLAERADGSFRQRVAVKIVRRDLGPGLADRFRAERQILAGLEHPNIARLLDGGTTGAGFPYLVMEHVDGSPIDEYCDRRRLDLRARLELFVAVCSAVNHAHRNLVVHRDLKPANVLVTGEGVPKLLDFGVAKLLSPSGRADPRDRTVTGQRPLTPSYASPEQLAGRTVTTATDVYSLGVVLYLLLAGTLPRRFTGVLPADVAEMLREPTRPSAVLGQGDTPASQVAERRSVTVAQLSRQLRGDLDNAVLKALRQDPEQRYPSVAELGEDLRRHLDGRPVHARPASWSYVAGKFVRRNPMAVLASGTVLALLIAVALTMAVQRGRLARERDRAEVARLDAIAERERAERTAELVTGMFDEVAPERALGRPVTVREVLDRRAGTLGRELAGQPELRAELQATIGAVYRKLGAYDEARELLEASLATRRALLGAGDPRVAETLSELSAVHGLQGDFPGAAAVLEEALAILRARPPADPTEMVPTLGRLAIARSLLGDVERAEELTAEVLEIQTRSFGPESAPVAHALHNYAIHKARHGRLAAARELFERALAIQRKLLTDEDPDVARSRHNLGVLYRETGRYDQSRELLTAALRAQERVLGERHDEVGETLVSLGDLLRATGDLEGAGRHYRRGAEIAEASLGPEHPFNAAIHHGRGRLALERGRLDEAERHLAAALEIRRRTPGGPDHGIVDDLAALAEVERRRGRLGRAAERLDEVRGAAGELRPTPWVAGALARVELARADLEAKGGDRAAAVAGWRRALALAGEAPGTVSDRRTRAEALERLGGGEEARRSGDGERQQPVPGRLDRRDRREQGEADAGGAGEESRHALELGPSGAVGLPRQEARHPEAGPA